MRFSISTRIALFTTLLVVGTAAIVGVTVFRESNGLLVEQEFENVVEGVEHQRFIIQADIDMLRNDVLFLSEMPPLQGIIRSRDGVDPVDGSTSEEWKNRLEIIFSNLLGMRPNYIQARLIGVANNGRELVRVDRTGQVISSIREKSLLKKSDTSYFKDALDYKKGEIYLSEISLNREHGEVSSPYTPVLRAITPVHDSNNELFGMVAINMDVSEIFSRYMKATPESSEHFFVNSSGDFLAHPDSAKVFGFEFGERYRIQDSYPEVSEIFDKRNINWGGTDETHTFKRNGQALRVIRVFYDQNDRTKFIALIVKTSMDHVMNNLSEVRSKSMMIGLLLIGVGVLVAYLLSRMISKPLIQITTAAKSYARGEYTSLLPVGHHGEIGTLATVLKEMGREIEKRTKELQHNEAKMKSIVDNAVDGIVTIDSEGVVQTFNSACEAIFGYRQEEIIGRNITLLMTSDHASQHHEYLDHYLRTGEAKVIGRKVEVEGRKKGGEIVPVQLSINEVMLGNERIFVAMVRDITEEKYSKQELIRYRDHLEELVDEQLVDIKHAKEVAEKANTAKSAFLANMSHELRTPLNSLLILSETLMQNNDQNLTETQQKSASIIYSSGQDLLLLINDILDLAKIESGKFMITREDYDLRAMVESIAKKFEYVAEKKRLNFSVEVDDDVASEMYSDRQRIEQILRNLISNAIKFTPEGGVKVHVASGGERIPGKETVVFTVTDTGIGIPQEKLQLIFNAFEQVDSTSCREYGGTGLGLSISRQLTEMLGGEIEVESTLGEGSLFRLILPVENSDSIVSQIGDEKSSAPEWNQYARASASSGVTSPCSKSVVIETPDDDRDSIKRGDEVLLVIEDDLHFARILYAKSRQKGLKCLIAHTGNDGILLAQKYNPSAIFLDIGLPDISGTEVFERIQSDKKTRDIPVYFISVYDDDEGLVKNGAVGYLTKPITQDQLNKAVDQIRAIIADDVRRILVVEDDLPMQQYLKLLFQHKGIDVAAVETAEDALALLKQEKFCGILLDLMLPGMSGLELLETISADETIKQPPVMIYSGKEITDDEKASLKKYTDTFIRKQDGSEKLLTDVITSFRGSDDSESESDNHDSNEFDNDAHKEVSIPMGVSFHGLKALLVDDDRRNTFALSLVLDQAGFETITAEDGQQALKRLEEHPDIDIVLMDIMMPVMDGYEAIEKIRSMPGHENLPILAVTAKAMDEDRDRCMEIGATDYLAKPVEAKNLFVMMSNHLKQCEENESAAVDA